MNIAIFGWYHHRNAGDDRIQQCLTRWLDGHTLAFLPAGRRPPVALLRTCDAAILGGGGLIRDHGGMFRDMARWVRRAGIPVALAGVSVEGITPELRRELRELLDLDLCCFAWFRDRGSLEAVGDHPRAFVAPDATWLYPFEPAAEEGSGLAVSVAPGTLQPREAWRDAFKSFERPLHPWPLYFENGGDGKALRELIPDAGLPGEFDLEPARRAAAVLAGRFHALLFALQLGRPALVASDAPKVRRFLDDNGLRSWIAAEPGALQWSGTRDEALRVRSRLHDEVWEKTASARDRLLEAASRLPPPNRRLRNLFRI